MIITTVVKRTRQSFSHSSEFNSNAAAAAARAYTYIYIYTWWYTYYIVICIRIRAPGWRWRAGVTRGVWVCGWATGGGTKGGRENVTRRRYIKRVIGLPTTTEAASSGIDPSRTPHLVACINIKRFIYI